MHIIINIFNTFETRDDDLISVRFCLPKYKVGHFQILAFMRIRYILRLY